MLLKEQNKFGFDGARRPAALFWKKKHLVTAHNSNYTTLNSNYHKLWLQKLQLIAMTA